MAFFTKKTTTSTDGPLIPWAGTALEAGALDPHFAIAGMTGSGKTMLFKALMGAVLSIPAWSPVKEARRLGAKALIYDPKREFYSVLRGMGIPREAITILHPFDRRCSAWDLSADIKDTASARQLAAILCPEDVESTNPFFALAAQEIVFAVIEALRANEGAKWSLRDVVEASLDRAVLERVLGWTDVGKETKATYVTEHKTTIDILATLRSKIGRFAVVASLWHHAKGTPFSLTRWLASNEPGVVLVGADSANSESIRPINRALFRRFSELVTARNEIASEKSNAASEQIWVFLDELRMAGDLHGLDALLLEGRSKGARVVLGFQDIEGLYEVYGEHVARELVGQCGNRAILRLGNTETMRWAAEFVGEKRDYFRTTVNTQAHEDSKLEFRDMAAMLAVEFRLLRRPVRGRAPGFEGFFVPPDKGSDDKRELSEEWIQRYVPGVSTEESDCGFVGNYDDTFQRRVPWTTADDARFAPMVDLTFRRPRNE